MLQHGMYVGDQNVLQYAVPVGHAKHMLQHGMYVGSSACVAICGAYGSYNYKTHVAAWNACDSKHMFQHCMYVGHVLQQEMAVGH